ncbi:hypothetical protein PHYPSEUDO_013633 [Phytophthora pseudosyringae]|uniref:Uncharacterized protein n=1 Tax=Phytophthora pseudosyringae TaxID=221518 RepID=A0A8T1W1V3_9STRA|nr:hypothetical protein PHYPSEUDO_013633 [Phytophthora pseudosyringae]
MTPPPLTVASAAFFHLECSHAQLFHSEYKRSNRTRGLKILRCFPHCCPEHIDRSYCGTSLSIRVDLAPSEPDAPPTDPSVVSMFARFEAVSDVSLRAGECVEVDRIAAATQTESNPEGPWMAGTLDKPCRLVTAIRTTSPSTDDPQSLVFHLNTKSYAKWYYDWESGANKAHRLLKHVIKAYVMERCAVDKDSTITDCDSSDAAKQLYRVLHVETSPEFTLVSYRRASTDQYQGAYMEGGVSPYDEAALRGESPVGSYGRGYAHHPRVFVAKTTDWRSPMEAKPPPLYTKPNLAKRQRTPTQPARQLEEERDPDLLDDKLRWECNNLSTVSVSRNLALVYALLRWAPLSVYTSFVDELVHGVNDSLLGSLVGSSQETSGLNCFSKLLLNQARSDGGAAVPGSFVHDKRVVDKAPASMPRGLETLLGAVAGATMWLFSAETRQWMRTFLRHYAGRVMDKHALRECFVLFLRELQTRLDAQIFAQTPLVNLANAAEEVIATVYSYEYFHARRPRVRKILSGQSFVGWSAFVAQMRETYINMSSCPAVPRNLMKNHPGLDFALAHPPQNAVESDWNAEWLMDVDEAVWKSSEEAMEVDISDIGGLGDIDSDDGAVSLFTLFEIISQIVRVEVGIDTQARTMHIRSTQGVAGALDCMRLVLDGKDRVFSQFPNAVATGIDTGAYGNYIGEMQAEKSGRLVVYLQLFNWSVREDGPSYHTRVRIECWHSRRLCISGDILATTAPASFTPEEALYVSDMLLRDKREAVNSAHTQQLRDNPAARWAASANPWKELGRFGLGYSKV